MRKMILTLRRGMVFLSLLALLLAAGCKDKVPADKPSQDKGAAKENTTPSAPVTTTTAPAKPLVSAETTSFEAVTAKLDAGGNLFAYVGMEQWLAGTTKEIGEIRDLILSFPGPKPEDRENINQAFDMIQRLIRASGVENISGAGWSGIALEKGFYRQKFALHHYPGQGSGNLWTSFGAKPHPLHGLDLLPANTAAAFFFDVEPQELWATLEKEALAAGIPQQAAGVQSFKEGFQKELQLDFQKALASLGGEVGVALVLDPAKKFTIPLPDQMSLTIPGIGLMVAVKVTDDTLFDRLDQQFAKDPNFSGAVQKVDEADLRMRSIPVPVPLPVAVRFTFARHGDYLLLATHDELVRAAVSVKAGKTPGLKSTEEFKRLARELPIQGNGFSFVSRQAGDTVAGLLQDGIRIVGQREPGMEPALTKLAALFKVPQSYSVAVNTEEGWLVTGHTTQDPSTAYVMSSLMAPAAGVAIMGGLTLPALANAKRKAQQIACQNNVRQLEIAKQQWALDHRKSNTATPAWTDLVGQDKYLPERLECPTGGSYTLGNLRQRPACSLPDHNRFGQR